MFIEKFKQANSNILQCFDVVGWVTRIASSLKWQTSCKNHTQKFSIGKVCPSTSKKNGWKNKN